MTDILKNYTTNYNKSSYIHSSQNSSRFSNNLEKYDILLTDSNYYSVNNSKLLLNTYFGSERKYKPKIKRYITPLKVSNMDINNSLNNNNNKTENTSFHNNNHYHNNTTVSTFYNTSNSVKIKNKKDKNYQKLIDEKSDKIVDYLLNSGSPSIYKLKMFHKNRDWEKIATDVGKNMNSIKIRKIEHKFLFDPLSHDKEFCSYDLQIKNLGSEKYRDNLLNGISDYYLKNKNKQFKIGNEFTGFSGISKKLIRAFKENKNLRFNFAKHNNNFKYQNNVNKNYPNLFIYSDIKNKDKFRDLNSSFDAKTNMILLRTKELEKFAAKRVKDHQKMKNDLYNI